MLLEFVAIVGGYLLGSIPTAYIVARLRKGIDIRDVDAGNMGAGAVLRQIGLWEGALVAIVDIAKGAVAILIAQALGISQPWVLAAGFAALLGHSFPVYVGFRGGQGAATVIGVFLVLAPEPMAVILLIMAIVLLITRHIFSTIAIAGPLLPLLIWLFGGSLMLILFSLAVVLFILFRNRHKLKEVRITKR